MLVSRDNMGNMVLHNSHRNTNTFFDKKFDKEVNEISS